MEITTAANWFKKLAKKLGTTLLLLALFACAVYAQPAAQRYFIKDGKMFIQLNKHADETALDEFIAKYDLADLNLRQFLQNNIADSLQQLGWTIEKNNQDIFVISKYLKGVDNYKNLAEKIINAAKMNDLSGRFPAIDKNIKYGYNSFKKKFAFAINDSLVTFFLRNNSNARQVMLAGSFNNWGPAALAMKHTDSGWIAAVKLGPGKYWYKFIIDGNWAVDRDNDRVENDGQGNDNSVFFKPNTTFRLNGYGDAKKVFIAGSFNNWKAGQLQMTKTSTGWQLPLYLGEGTHTYRFVVDGKWITDAENKDRLPNEFNDFNSVVRNGVPFVFKLNGYPTAQKVMLSGSFNNWRKNELFMNKTANGWELPYTLGEGNYEYQYRVNNTWVTGNETNPQANANDKPSNAFLIIGANYTFHLKGFAGAKNIYLAGDFNNWSPNGFAMQKTNDGWDLRVHLTKGKHVYKFVIDGKWITDPNNKLWEQNEFGTGNSVLWFNP